MKCSKCGGILGKTDRGLYVCTECGAKFKASKPASNRQAPGRPPAERSQKKRSKPKPEPEYEEPEDYEDDFGYEDGYGYEDDYEYEEKPRKPKKAKRPERAEAPQPKSKKHPQQAKRTKLSSIRPQKPEAMPEPKKGSNALPIILGAVALVCLLIAVVIIFFIVPKYKTKLKDMLPGQTKTEYDEQASEEATIFSEVAAPPISEETSANEVTAETPKTEYTDATLLNAFPKAFRLAGEGLPGGLMIMEEDSDGRFYLLIDSNGKRAEYWVAGDNVMKYRSEGDGDVVYKAADVTPGEYKNDDGSTITVSDISGEIDFGPASASGIRLSGTRDMNGIAYDEYVDDNGASYLINPTTGKCDHIISSNIAFSVEEIPAVTAPSYPDSGLVFESDHGMSLTWNAAMDIMSVMIGDAGTSVSNDAAKATITIDPAEYPDSKVYVNGEEITEAKQYEAGTVEVKVVDKNGGQTSWTT